MLRKWRAYLWKHKTHHCKITILNTFYLRITIYLLLSICFFSFDWPSFPFDISIYSLFSLFSLCFVESWHINVQPLLASKIKLDWIVNWWRAVRPVCRSDQKRIYGVARNEMAKILCEVDAFPPPTTFKWSFNNTAETIDMPQNGFEKHSRTTSRLSYTPVKVCVPNYLF